MTSHTELPLYTESLQFDNALIISTQNDTGIFELDHPIQTGLVRRTRSRTKLVGVKQTSRLTIIFSLQLSFRIYFCWLTLFAGLKEELPEIHNSAGSLFLVAKARNFSSSLTRVLVVNFMRGQETGSKRDGGSG